MEKIYERINFVNDSSPFVDADNLNKMDSAIDELDNRVVSLGGFTPVIDESGKITGYTTEIGGADTVFPFSGGNTALLAFEAAPVNAVSNEATNVFSNDDYFDTTNGNICTRKCSGTIYLRWRQPITYGGDTTSMTITLSINNEVIYTTTTSSASRENIDFSLNVGDVVKMTVQKTTTSCGRAPAMAFLIGN